MKGTEAHENLEWQPTPGPASRSRWAVLPLALIGLALAVALYFISRANYPLFHSIVDGATVFIAGSIFLVVWHGRRCLDNHYHLLIAVAFLAFALLDFVHLLGNQGLGVFHGYGNLGPAFYIAGRYVLGVSFLLAPLFVQRKLRMVPVLAAYLLVVALVLLSVFYWRNFPATYIEGRGLTPFKIYSDYAVGLMLLGGLGLLLKQRRAFDARVLTFVALALGCSIATGLVFTLYVNPFGLANTVGHGLQLASFALVYLGFVETIHTQPQEVLYRALRQSEARLQQALSVSRSFTFEWLPATDAVLRSASCAAILKLDGREATEDTGRHFFERIHPDDRERFVQTVRRLTPASSSYVAEYRVQCGDSHLAMLEEVGQAAFDAGGQLTRLVGVTTDVTERKRAEAALRQSHERLKKVVEVENVGVLFWDLDTGTLVDANETFLKMMGYRRSDLNAHDLTWQKLTPPEYHEVSLAEIKKFQATGRVGPYEKEYLRKDGSRQWMLFAGSSLGGNQCVEFCVDISVQKQAEAALRESEKRNRVLIGTIMHGIVHQRADGTIIAMNAAAERILGRSPAEFLGSSSVQEEQRTIHEDGSPFPGLEHPAMVALRTGQPVRGVVMGVWNSQRHERRWIEIDAVPLSAPGRTQPVEVYTVFADITERKQAEESLRQLNATLEQRVAEQTAAIRQASAYNRSLIDASPDPLVTIGPDGRITDVNTATEQATGLGRQQLVGSDFSDYFTEPDKARAGYQKVFRDGFVRDYPLEIRRADGSTTPVLYNATVYRDAGGRIVGVFAAARDVSEMKKAQAALQQAHDLLEQHVAERTAELARSNQELEQFAYVASHDLQEPLRMVNGFLRLLETKYKPQLDAKAGEYIGFAVEGATRMAQLIRDLLEYSRAGRGKELEPVDLGAALDVALAGLGAAIKEAGACVTHDKLPVVQGDAAQLPQLLQNLIGNAVKFRSADRPCQVHVGVQRVEDPRSADRRPDAAHWQFSVCDNGIGIAPEYAERIFEIFQRLHTREEYPGTGIGLAICKKIVERHGGRLWVESNRGQGSCFLFTLPGAVGSGAPAPRREERR